MRVGIVGCGNIAGNHVTAFRAAAGIEVVACREATKSLAILTALYASAKSGRPEQVLKETYT